MLLSSALIKHHAFETGFTACGMSPAERVASWQEERVRNWLRNGQHADMEYLERNVEKRLDPRLLVEGAQSIVSVALNYYPEQTLAADGYSMARYAYGKDYHDVVRNMLRQLMQRLGLQEHIDGRVFCDTAPVSERYWAWRCGLGWIGKNTQLIIPHCAPAGHESHDTDEVLPAGSYFFLGELILLHSIDHYDQPVASRCGTCRRCIEACPANALSEEKGLDARRCLSFLTIENRNDIPNDAAQSMHNCIYGCDRCAEACPWNRYSKPTQVADFSPSPDLQRMTRDDWQHLTVEQYRSLFKGSAVKRAKYEGLVRNIRAAATAAQTTPDEDTAADMSKTRGTKTDDR